MTAIVQYELTDLLEQSGARPRGARHDCPKCGGRRTVSNTDEVFFCHKCQWKGNVITLKKELGIYQRIPSAEYRELERNRERVRDAAERLYRAAKARRFELYDGLRSLARIETGANRIGPSEVAWGALAVAYEQRPGIEAELERLENGSAQIVFECLTEVNASWI